ncbi:uncharacterized protein [Halyomorpha halys]|uniref:uncharacterized protein n=1 Tax=Halyomorpha halys TaxID=286706 RepID=UPI0006D4CAAC|nr:uncharacterized protein LOC106687464 [Halyomorpha halys]
MDFKAQVEKLGQTIGVDGKDRSLWFSNIIRYWMLFQLILISTLNAVNEELTSSCVTAKSVWDKLVSTYEQSSSQTVNRLLESFFSHEVMSSYNVMNYVARLQREFNELNVELKTLSQSELPELILMCRIMSTLPPPYFEFRRVWESVPIQDRTVNSLTEKLKLIEMRLPGKDSKVDHALIAKEPYKKKVAVGGKNQPASKTKSSVLICYKCKGENHMARNCPTKIKKETEDRGTESLSTQRHAFICHHMLGLGGDQCLCLHVG